MHNTGTISQCQAASCTPSPVGAAYPSTYLVCEGGEWSRCCSGGVCTCAESTLGVCLSGAFLVTSPTVALGAWEVVSWVLACLREGFATGLHSPYTPPLGRLPALWRRLQMHAALSPLCCSCSVWGRFSCVLWNSIWGQRAFRSESPPAVRGMLGMVCMLSQCWMMHITTLTCISLACPSFACLLPHRLAVGKLSDGLEHAVYNHLTL